jgi:PhnB protein
MKLYPHLAFNGECEAAFQFYAQCFGGEIITMLAYGNSPMAEQAPPEWRGKILHATLSFGDNVLAGSDSIPGQYEQLRGFQVLLGVDDPADAERIFNALAENGTVLMPIQQTFWARRFGVLVDRFGIPWEINCEQG